MFDLSALADTAPFAVAHGDKTRLMDDALADLTRHHYAHCPEYKRMLDKLRFDPGATHGMADLPFLPVRLFKDFELKSVDTGDVIKTMTSSGTSGQQVSKIYLDRATATNQTKVLTRIVSDFIGSKRLPMLVVDCPSTVKDRTKFSARGAGILGFSMFGRDHTYALADDMTVDEAAIRVFAEKHAGGPVLLFGFTFIVFEHFVERLRAEGRKLFLDNGILIHGGGWKKLVDRAVDNDTFKARLDEATGIKRVHNYYGMVEQTGSIFMECEHGRLHSSIYSDIIVRRPDFSVCDPGEPGLVELVSLLPTSYPGHVIITEDIGEVIGEDDCPCGRLGKTFKIHGRASKAEIRGCSDTFSAD